MRVLAEYSHLNSKEYLMVHKPKLLKEIRQVIESVDAAACKTKVSKGKKTPGKMLYSSVALNDAFRVGLGACGWSEERNTFWVTHDEKVLRGVYNIPAEEQKNRIKEAGYEPIMSYNQTDFVKDRVAVEVQFGKYSFVAHDLFVKHLGFFVADTIDVGVEILPMKELEQEMSSGVPYYERDLMNVIRQGRGVPAVPLVLMGVAP